ncbi:MULTISPECIES: HAAS signaling domain-containing protein [Paenibacillus]|uniref:HAAS signaling domain-containing protein n=1 Tax=Paenibacillus TaxID=44249 RepID=UPI00096C0EB7|nr:hypothetical protein [Paenibacillus odorifer]OMC97923.1 hypothetical protein BJP46_24685 [Paenibacillus odorifer]OMD12833.1 hypothetical protein BJP50_24125 [Paenibacillus odorifer]
MKLIEIYIHEVTRRLPEQNREDIALELRSTIEDMLPDDYDEKEVTAVLEKLGNPAILASEYRDQPMYLIGPRYFDLYVTLLKMIIPIAVVVSLIALVADYLIGYSGDKTVADIVTAVISTGIGTFLEVGIQVFFWITVVFAIIERADKGKEGHPLTTKLRKWTPDDLKDIALVHKKKAITSFEVFGSLLWTAIWATVYFNAEHLIRVYRGGEGALNFVAPAFNQHVLLDYWPIILIVIGLEVALTIYKLIKRQWTRELALCNTVLELIVLIVFAVILINPNVFNQEFINYMSNLLTTTANQFETGLVGGGIAVLILVAVLNIYEGFRKARL